MIHIIGAVYILRKECLACKIDFFDYLVVCYNGRLEWVPFITHFESIEIYEKFYQKWKVLDQKNNTFSLILDFDVADYQFSEESAQKIIKALRF